MIRYLTLILITFTINFYALTADEESEKPETKGEVNSKTLSALKFRGIGPAVTSGRISDIAVNPDNPSEWYVAFASGGVWKTNNSGLSFIPIFDAQGSYSIGCISLDPNNSNVVWVGSGENNSQRSVSYGDGVYKSIDGGQTWENLGLKNSEHIAKIIVDPRNSSVVYVAAQGPLWGPGGDRGLYKSTDGGKTWEKSLEISEHTGVTDLIIDPRNPDVLYCASYQRARHVWTLINGGPEAAIYKSSDAGKTWNKLGNGLPSGELGRIGLAISPADPDVIYATIEAEDNKGGFYCSTNRGASWSKRNTWFSPSAQYYTEIFCDPNNVELLYVMDTYSRISYDGGRSFDRISTKYRHVDDHALWIDPSNTMHFLIGGDGGLYETYDRGETFRYFANLPTTQIYRIAIDNAEPFYNIYYGTQDNNTWGGPSRSINSDGTSNEPWFQVVGGDGYQARIDPTNPNIVYGQWQYGNLVRYDRKSGEVFYIQPQPKKGELLRWNWDTPLIISNFSTSRLYIAANKLFRSDNRGESWSEISDDLTRQIDRNQLPIMGKVWGPDAVAKNASTSLYGNIVSLSESPIDENLLYVGTDDGLIQITEDGGKSWSKVAKFAGVPETTYVSDIFASQHDVNVVYATFNNHKRADFKPYVMKSNDKGKTWTAINAGLPDNHPIWTIYEDHIKPELLFLGTEFSFFVSIDGGDKWLKHNSGLPTIAVRDIEIQKRENDICLGTFGRGIYILDDYSPLRNINKEILKVDAHIFPVKDGLMYNPDNSFDKNSHGSSFYRAPNPEFGVTFTYYLKESIKTKKQVRKEKETKAQKDGTKTAYPSLEELQAEDEEQSPYLIFKIIDKDGNTIRLLEAPATEGINRISWDMTYPDVSPVNKNTNINKHSGMRVMPGDYQVVMAKNVDGQISVLTEPVTFSCKVLDNLTLPPINIKERVDFQNKVARLQNAVMAATELLKETKEQVDLMEKSLKTSINIKKEALMKIRTIKDGLNSIHIVLNGNPSISSRNENQTPALSERLMYILWGIWGTSSTITATQKDAYKIASEQMVDVLAGLNQLISVEISSLKAEMQKLNSPWVPGTLPKWIPE